MKIAGIAFWSALAALGFGAGCDQAQVTCTAARGDFAFTYRLVSAGDDCLGIPGEVVGVQVYTPEGNGGDPDEDHPSLALRAQTLGELAARAAAADRADPDPGHSPNAYGAFAAATPDPSGACLVPTWTVAEQRLPELPAIPAEGGAPDTPAQPATDITYRFEDARVYVTPSDTGTQLSATLHVAKDGCTATYHAVGLYPAVPCDDGTGHPDPTQCSPDPDPAAGRATGSGINPDLPTVCDPQLLFCVLAGEPPAHK